jgi:replication factor C large subunit
MQLWTEKYAPEGPEGIVGQGKAVSEAMSWMSNWKKGKALFLHGPPGSGKTLLAEIMARQGNLQLIRMNASDKRTSDGIDSFLSDASSTHSLFHKGKLILIDEVDGISGRSDRGGIPSIIRIIKDSSFPVIVIANDAWSTKLSSLRKVSSLVKFSKVMTPSIEKRLKEICREEGIGFDDDAIKGLARWSQGDMRSAIFDLQIVSMGRKSLTSGDMESLGFRERGSDVFSMLPTIFGSRNINASRKVIWESDRDPDEILLWIESNVHQVFREPEGLARAYDILSRADIFRARVHIQQNWRFKGLMSDMMAGVSLSGQPAGGYVPYQHPQRIMMLARSRSRRESMKTAASRIGEHAHCSRKIAVRDYFPYMKIILKKGLGEGSLELEPEEIKVIKEN